VLPGVSYFILPQNDVGSTEIDGGYKQYKPPLISPIF
jgi:hypothetical protein